MLGSSWQSSESSVGWTQEGRWGRQVMLAEVGAQQRLWAGAPIYGLSMWPGLSCNQPGGPKFLRPLSCLSPTRGQPGRNMWSLLTQPRTPEAMLLPCSFWSKKSQACPGSERGCMFHLLVGACFEADTARKEPPQMWTAVHTGPHSGAGWAPAYLPSHMPGSSRWMARWRRIWVKTWVRKIPGRRKWQLAPVFSSGESHGAWWATVHGAAKSRTRLRE